MKILSLDLSTKTGWAVLEHPALLGYGLIQVSTEQFLDKYPVNYIKCAKMIAQRIEKIVEQFKPTDIAIEETNQGGKRVSRYSQKQLEYIHFAVADMLLARGVLPKYVNSRSWQSIVGTALSKDQRQHNKALNEEKDKAKAKLKELCEQAIQQQFQRKLDACETPTQSKAIMKEARQAFKTLYKSECRKIRIQSLSGVVGRVTSKHLSVQKANEMFKLDLLQKDNDVADAILLGVGYWKFKQKENENERRKQGT